MESELNFEEQLVSYLSSGKVVDDRLMVKDRAAEYVANRQLWKYEPEIKTTADLWDNFKAIVYRHNRNVLDHELSVNEFNQVKKTITDLQTPYEAGQFIYGYGGKTQVEIDLDDGRHVFLTIFDQDKVGAGDTVYQVVTQIEREPVINGMPSRRFDTTLLINGLPIIQIEEKKASHDAFEALNQMHQYIIERQYTGIFSTLQILIGMTPNSIRYMANTTADKFNKDFAFTWQRKEDNMPVRNWKEFSDLMLSIPMAHQMATNYMILDGTKNHQMLKVMRSYQVYATQAVIDKIKHADFEYGTNKLGYIWHTTGSGKTITSFKTAWLASRLPNVNKVVFVVDRIALTRQTNANYKAYDPDASEDVAGVVQGTNNTNDLRRKLKSNDRSIIVTSVQKLDALVKRDNFTAPDKNIVFIVDEAHRSTGGNSFSTIQNKFKKAVWVGYTGTPMFDDTTKGLRTEDIFGPLLHAYTIREAIADKNVLGFKVDFETTISEDKMKQDYLPGFFKQQHPDWTDEQIEERVNNLTPDDIDDQINPSFYDENPQHIREVVKDIYKNWKVRSQDGRYNALLTTHVGGNKASTPMAMMYFDEFQRVNQEHRENGGQILKVGVTFSYNTNNSDNMVENNTGLHRAIKQYNQEFGTNFSLDSVDEYNQDLVSRLDKSADDGKYLDLVIVVDRLLTGFDAPGLNTLYVDRTLKGANLIQAYSRTNRIEKMETKSWGQVVNYRWPVQNEKLMNEALAIYANKDSADLTDEERQQQNVDNGITAPKFADLLAETQEYVSRLRELTTDFEQLPPSESDKTEMASVIRKYTINVNKLKQYANNSESEQIDGFDPNDPDSLTKLIGMSPQEEETLTYSLGNDLKRWLSEHKQIPLEQLELEITHIKDVKVNYDYLKELVEQLVNQVHDHDTEGVEATKKSIKQIVDTIDDEKHANDIRQMVNDIAEGNYPAAEDNVTYPLEIDDLDAFIAKHSTRSIKQRVLKFQINWGLTQVIKEADLRAMLLNHRFGMDDLDNDNALTELLKDASSQYKDYAQDEAVVKLSKIKYRNQLRDAIKKFADELVKM